MLVTKIFMTEKKLMPLKPSKLETCSVNFNIQNPNVKGIHR